MNAFCVFHTRALIILLSGWVVIASPTLADDGAGESHDAFAQALERALKDSDVSATLEVECRDEKGIRGFSLYPSGTLIWGQRRQAHAGKDLRQSLLETLAHGGFVHFEALYGGKGRLAEAKAPLQVFCRITAKIDSQGKTSSHAIGGIEFTPLLQLAAALLDQVEPVGKQGISADDFPDALTKLANGALAPETLSLRLTRFPPGVDAKAGVILRMHAGSVTRTAYRPGESAAQPEWRAITNVEFASTLAALHEAGFGSLPFNVPGSGVEELEVVVLGHRHAVMARAFARIAPNEMADEGKRFARLVETLLKLVGDTGLEPVTSAM